MARLTAADQVRLLAFVHGADGAAGVPALDRASAPDYILSALAGLVVAECVLYRPLDGTHPGWMTIATEPQILAHQNTGRERWNALIARRENPMVAHWDDGGSLMATRMSDFVDRSALHRLTIYNEFWRPHGVERMLGARIQVNPSSRIDLGFYRTGSDFSERDVAVLEYARVLIERIVQRADLAGLIAATVATFGVSSREAEILAWVARGKTNSEIALALVIAPGTVKKHLDHIYRKLSIRTRTQAAVAALAAGWAAEAEIELRDPGELVREATGLTTRETDVLALAAGGKTNAEIAAAMNIAAGTVKRHLENVYRKLKVGTRTEATWRALATVRDQAPTLESLAQSS